MRFQLLGPVEVRDDDGVPVALPGGRARAILAMLLLARPGVVSPQRLFETGQSAKDPANALHVQIAKLRAALPQQRLVSQHGGYRLVAEPGEVDADVFVEECERGQRLAAGKQYEEAARVIRAALALWQEPVRYDFAESWLARLDEVRLTALETLVDAELALGHDQALVPELTGLVAAHPLRERFSGQLMTALLRSGRRSEALAVSAELRERLADELGADPAPDIAALHLELLRDDPGRPTGNLPHPIGTLIGRDADLAGVRGLLAEHRLVTLTGPGGVGKTRTASELGHQLRDHYRDGAWLVELAPLARDASVLDAIATTLGFEEGDRLLSYLRDREVLLVLDNCEHVIDDAAAGIRLLLGRCERLTVLATSREPLNVEGERVASLQPLALEEAVRLFRDRAPSVPDDEVLAQLCDRLDRLPLALELAAAGTRLFSLRQIESKLDDLANVSRHAPARHHSLRTVLAWSHDLLTPEEKAVFAGLSVFRDGCTFADAERVCGATVGLLAQLVDKSLVVPGPDDRFRLLDTVRGYAESTTDTSVFRARHAEAMLALAHEVDVGLTGPRQHELMVRMLPELPNLRAVTAWLLDRGEGAKAIILHSRLGYFWHISGREAEGTHWLGRAVECFDAAPVPGFDQPLAIVLGWHGYLGLMSGAHPDPWRSVQRVRDLYRENPAAVRIALPSVAAVAVYERPGAEAQEVLEEAEAAIAGLDDEPWVRGVLDALWSEQHRRNGDLAAAVEAATSNLRFFEALGDPFGIVYSHLRLGDAEELSGHREQARARWTRARDVARASFAPVKCGYAELRLAYLDLADDPVAAATRLDRVRAQARELAADDLGAAAANLLGLLLLRQGRAEAAVLCFREVAGRAGPVRTAVAAAHLVALDGLLWLDEAVQAAKQIADPVHLAALHALLRGSEGLGDLLGLLPERPDATPLAALI
ncbi:BTAD domain-containing putative transcriptional regulator [Lentzea sp. NPDC051213]|uniref:BTAD domain-containing putative transcriptional regulator n=1 Tax=Lentzea sp. NPDC051213 TaxID=3364126 RepID=UPI003791F269